jgi:hypothetical protein
MSKSLLLLCLLAAAVILFLSVVCDAQTDVAVQDRQAELDRKVVADLVKLEDEEKELAAKKDTQNLVTQAYNSITQASKDLRDENLLLINLRQEIDKFADKETAKLLESVFSDLHSKLLDDNKNLHDQVAEISKVNPHINDDFAQQEAKNQEAHAIALQRVADMNKLEEMLTYLKTISESDCSNQLEVVARKRSMQKELKEREEDLELVLRQVRAIEAQIAQKNSLIQDRDDTIARLKNVGTGLMAKVEELDKIFATLGEDELTCSQAQDNLEKQNGIMQIAVDTCSKEREAEQIQIPIYRKELEYCQITGPKIKSEQSQVDDQVKLCTTDLDQCNESIERSDSVQSSCGSELNQCTTELNTFKTGFEGCKNRPESCFSCSGCVNKCPSGWHSVVPVWYQRPLDW